jgi:hypothetical protein
MSTTPKQDPPKDDAKPRYGPGSGFHGKCGRSGPPVGSQNAARHFLKAGKLPKKLQYVGHRINQFRRHLEEAVAAVKGEVSIVDAAAVNSACKWERHGILAQHWLRCEADKLSATERLKFSEAIAKASDNRDRNLRALGLDHQVDPWTVIDSPTHEEQADEQTEQA